MLKSPVGTPGKSGNGKLVKNTVKDIVVLRRMLNSNGYKLPEEGRFDAKMGAVIKGAQKKCGIKIIDGVIIPGDKTYKSLVTKYMLAEKLATNVKMLTFKVGNTTHQISEKDYKKAVPQILKTVEKPTRQLIQKVDYTMDRYKFYLDTAQKKHNLMMALVQASIMTIGRIDFPSDKKMSKALDARNALDRSVRGKDLVGFCKAMRTAESDINAFVEEFRTFVQKMEGNGNKIEGQLKVISSVAFTAVEFLAVPVIMTYTRLPPDKAYLASKTAVAGIESLSKDLGKHISGQKVTASGALGRVSYAMAKELVLGWCGGKIKFEGKLLTRTMKTLGPAVTKAFPFIPNGLAARFLSRYIQGSAEALGKAVLSALITAVEGWMKKGSPPSKTDIENLFDDVLKKAVLGGLSKNLGKFNKAWAKTHQDVLKSKIALGAFVKMDSRNELDDSARALILKKFIGKVEGSATSKGYDAVFSQGTGNETGAALNAIAAKALRNDRDITAVIEDLIRKELKQKRK